MVAINITDYSRFRDEAAIKLGQQIDIFVYWSSTLVLFLCAALCGYVFFQHYYRRRSLGKFSCGEWGAFLSALLFIVVTFVAVFERYQLIEWAAWEYFFIPSCEYKHVSTYNIKEFFKLSARALSDPEFNFSVRCDYFRGGFFALQAICFAFATILTAMVFGRYCKTRSEEKARERRGDISSE